MDARVADTCVFKRKLPLTVNDIQTNKRRRSLSPTSTSSYDSADESHGKSGTITPITPLTPKSPSSQASSRPKTFKCPYPSCNKAFDRPARLEYHKRSHSNSRPFKCPHQPCTKDFLRNEHLQQHVASAHTDSKAYTCTWQSCGKAFSTGTRLRRHEALHQRKEQFTCKDYPPCSQVFRKHNTLAQHIASVHLKLPTHRCMKIDAATGEECGARFEKPSGLRAHEAKCHSDARYWCSFCVDPPGNSHHNTSASSESEITLNTTAPAFATYSELRTHILISHPPCCTYCPFIARTPRELQSHIDISHAETLAERRSFRCEVQGCGKAFTKRGNLAIHIRNVHEKVKMFECAAPISIAGDKDAVVKGSRTWNGHGACGRRFSTKQSLEIHIQRRHSSGSRSNRGSTKKIIKYGKTLEQNGKRKKKTRQSPLEALTGMTVHGIQCVIVLCDAKFNSVDDMERHCLEAHGMDQQEIGDAFAEREALSGGRFWIGGDVDEDEDQSDEDEEEEDDLTELDRPAVRISGGNTDLQYRSADSIEWRDDADMADMLSSYVESVERAGHDRMYEEVIDPALLSVVAG